MSFVNFFSTDTRSLRRGRNGSRSSPYIGKRKRLARLHNSFANSKSSKKNDFVLNAKNVTELDRLVIVIYVKWGSGHSKSGIMPNPDIYMVGFWMVNVWFSNSN